jgi:cysteine synthase
VEGKKKPLRHNRICDDITDLVGDTPMVRLNHIIPPTAERTACAKLEFFNPVGSIKDRTAYGMITGAIRDGDLKPETTCVEPTSGNTGVALSVFLNLLGYKKPIVTAGDQIPDGKRTLLTLTTKSMDLAPDDACPRFPGEGAIASAFGYKNIKDHFVPYQYANPHNPEIHYQTTGPEIWEQTGGKITHFVSGIGTGGTITGTGRFLKEKNPGIKIIAVEPSEQSHEFYGLRNTEYTMKPEIYDESLVDEKLLIDSDDAYRTLVELITKEGIVAGPSSGMTVYGMKVLEQRGEKGLWVAIVADEFFRYTGEILTKLQKFL